MTERLVVDAPAPLLAFLERRLSGWTRTTIKQRLRLGCVCVNGTAAVRHDHALQPGDTVEVTARREAPAPPAGPRGLPLLYVDEDLLAVDKPAGLLSVATARERERTALANAREWLSRPGHAAAVWPAHRLDRETSGVLLIARSAAVRDAVQATWDATRKVYLAVVLGRPDPDEGQVDVPLWEDGKLNVHAGEHADARPARTRYRTLESTGERSLLEVELDTGRRHQIRVHLAWLGHGIVGDARYGTPGPRMGLHARRLEVRHPRDKRRLVLEAPPPKALLALLQRRS
jgi:23S rRNA pseudouridine1911/1915/1917 synthase